MCKSNVSVVWRKCQHFFWWLGWSFHNLDQHWWQVTGYETLHLIAVQPTTSCGPFQSLSLTFDPERSLIMTFFCWRQSLQEHRMDWGHSDEAYDTSEVSVATWCFVHSKSKWDFFTMSRTLVWNSTCLLNVSGKILQSKHWTLCLHKYPTMQCSRWHSLADNGRQRLRSSTTSIPLQFKRKDFTLRLAQVTMVIMCLQPAKRLWESYMVTHTGRVMHGQNFVSEPTWQNMTH